MKANHGMNLEKQKFIRKQMKNVITKKSTKNDRQESPKLINNLNSQEQSDDYNTNQPSINDKDQSHYE